MAWSAPRTWVASEVVTAAQMNQEVRDNVTFLSTSTLGYAQVTATQNFTTEVDLTGLAVTVTVTSGRRIRVTGSVDFYSSAASDEITCYLKEGTTILQRIAWFTLVSVGGNRPDTRQRSVVLTPSAGSHTYKLTALRSQGAGTCTLQAAAIEPAFILVEDIGT